MSPSHDVKLGGFDEHAMNKADAAHEQLLATLSEQSNLAIDKFEAKIQAHAGAVRDHEANSTTI